jgi:iron complex outermembrane receptor protein
MSVSNFLAIAPLSRAARRALLGGASVLAVGLMPAVVHAQAAPESEADAVNSRAVDEIVVTARYKTESVQDTPQAITAFGEDQIAKMAARDLSDLSATAPNVTILPVSFSRTAAAINIRGMGAAGFESTEESPTGISVDGIFSTRPMASMLDTFDMQRVEVLRGPQGTSFGKNSLAGGIAAYTKNPGNDFDWSLEGTVGSYGRGDLKGAINLPIIEDKLAVRVVAATETVDGWFRNRFDGTRVAKGDTTTFRGTLLFTPTDDIRLNVKLFKIRDRSEQPGADIISDRSKLLYIVGGWEEPNDGPYTIGRNFPDEHAINQWGAIGNAEVDLGPITLTSITGYVKTSDSQKTDLDHSPVNFFHQLRVQKHDQFSQEIRLASDFSDMDGAISRLSLVLGGFYMEQSFAMTAAYPWIVAGPANQDVVQQDTTAKALFGQAIYGVTDRLNVTFGLRHSWESKDFLRDAIGVAASGSSEFRDMVSMDDMLALARSRVPVAGAPFDPTKTALQDSYDRERTTMKAALDYKINDNLMAYFTFAQGYKGGGYGARAASVTTMGPTEDNTSEMFEAGVKGDFFDRTLRLNLTAFQTKFKNLQFGLFFANPDVASGQETAEQNIGAATTRGLELETVWRATDGLTLNANIGYLTNKFTEFCADLDGPQAYGTAPTSNCGGQVTALPGGTYLVDEDHTDLVLSRAPKWSLQGGADYRWELGDAGSLLARASVAYKSAYFLAASNDPVTLSGDYGIVDASLTWESANGRYRAMLWGKNLTDKTYNNGVVPTANLFIQRYYSPPRTVGLTLSVKG